MHPSRDEARVALGPAWTHVLYCVFQCMPGSLVFVGKEAAACGMHAMLLHFMYADACSQHVK